MPQGSTAEEEEARERLAPYIAGWKRRLAAEREADERHGEEAWEVARRAARLLAEEFGVRRVVVFGSLAWGRFRRGSDVDLAVEGLSPRRFFRADARLAGEMPLPIDLKLLDDCPAGLRKRIEEEGVRVDGAA